MSTNIQKENECQPLKQSDGTQINQQLNDDQQIESQKEKIESEITSERNKGSGQMCFALVDFGLVLGALIALPPECKITSLEDYFIIAVSLTSFKIMYLCYHNHVHTKKLKYHIARRERFAKDPKSLGYSEAQALSLKKDRIYLLQLFYIQLLFELGYFIYANIVIYGDMKTACKIGEPQYNYTWGVALYFLIERYIVVAVLLFCSCCCLPCIIIAADIIILQAKEKSPLLEQKLDDMA